MKSSLAKHDIENNSHTRQQENNNKVFLIGVTKLSDLSVNKPLSNVSIVQ